MSLTGSAEERIMIQDLVALQKAVLSMKVEALEELCLTKEQVDCPVVHHFSPGVCVREVRVAAGTFAIGHRQKKEHLNIFIKGALIAYKDDGTSEELRAPMIFTSPPGRKVGYIIEDMVWLNVYPTDKTSVAEVEEEFIDKSEVSKSHYASKLATRLLAFNADLEDYQKVLQETGYTEEAAQIEVQNTEDLIPFPPGAQAVKVDASVIHGQGLFAMASFAPGDFICVMKKGNFRTPAGRYTNHAKRPNAEPRAQGEDINLYALTNISGCSGGFNGDEITIDYRAAMKARAGEQEDICQQ